MAVLLAIWTFIVGFVPRAVMQGVPLLYGSTGEILTEKSGNLNLGIPGIMYVGGISGVIGAVSYEHAANGELNPFWAIFIPFLCALAGSALMSLIYCFLTITLRANQNVTGLALTTFGVGIGNFFGGYLAKIFSSGSASVSFTETSTIFKTKLPFADSLGGIGKLIFNYGFLVYLAVIIALIAAFVLNRTRVGLNLRAVGENPATADAAGISVTKYKYFATCIGGAIAGLGGLYYVIDYIGCWSNDGFGDRGWLAIALVIFALWKPKSAIFGSFLFGGLYIVDSYINIGENLELKSLIQMLPYVVTIIVLVITSMRKKREHQPPESLGLSYFREER